MHRNWQIFNKSGDEKTNDGKIQGQTKNSKSQLKNAREEKGGDAGRRKGTQVTTRGGGSRKRGGRKREKNRADQEGKGTAGAQTKRKGP